MNEEFDFFEGQGRGEEERDLHFKIVLSIIIGKHMKMFLFKFNRNRTIPNSKFYYNVLVNVVFQIRAKLHRK